MFQVNNFMVFGIKNLFKLSTVFVLQKTVSKNVINNSETKNKVFLMRKKLMTFETFRFDQNISKNLDIFKRLDNGIIQKHK